jgi:hypothetical protein
MKLDPLENNSEREHAPKRLIAAREIAAVERNWSAARALDDGEEFAGLSREERIKRLGVHQAFYELVEIQGAAADEADIILELFAENNDLANATLERVEMNGDWSAADAFERELLGMVYDAGYKGSINRIARESDEARRSITIPAGFTEQHDFVALRRKRTLLVASHINSRAVRPSIEVDKVSTFALDISKLTELSDPTAKEVRLIVAGTIYKAIDWNLLRTFLSENEITLDKLDSWRAGFNPDELKVEDEDPAQSALHDYFNLLAIMERNHITHEQIQNRAFNVELPTTLHSSAAQEFIEESLHERSDLLTPAATTYYVHS